MCYDPLSITEAAVALAAKRHIGVTPIDLQRLIYFANGLHLAETELPLVNGCFEAWKYGPVHPVIFNALEGRGPTPTTFRARRFFWFGRPQTPQLAPRALKLIDGVLTHFDKLGSAQIAHLARAENAPWHYVVWQAKSYQTINLRITHTIVRNRFHLHKVVDPNVSVIEPPPDDAPFSFHDLLGSVDACPATQVQSGRKLSLIG